jgi:activator of HSP90 ATPase
MDETCNLPALVVLTSRRQLIAAAASFGALAFAPVAFTRPQQQPQQGMKESPSTPANASRTSLHQEIPCKVPPQRLYEVLLDSKQFAAFTGMPADIAPSAGGAFKMFGGMIEGRNVELVPNQRIVQAWRPSHWDPGVYSIAKFELKPQGSGVLVVLDHTGFPEGDYDHLYDGWTGHYWDPLTKYFAS